MADSTIRIVSLFSGIGGLDLGVHRALRRLGRTPRTVCYVEGEAFAVGTLAAQAAAGRLAAAPVWSDVRTFGAGVCPEPADLLIGGFPCQDISSAGKRVGLEGQKSGLFFELARVVRELEPEFVFLENVRGITVRGLDTVLGTLAGLGFDAEWTCLRASDIGAPHKRERWFCLAYYHSRPLREPKQRQQRGQAEQRSADDEPRHDGGKGLADAARDVRLGQARQERDRRGVRKVLHALADCDSSRLQGERRRPENKQRDADGCGSSWPPGPDDAEGWRRYLERWPGAEPAVRRGADGLSARLDRLRALGNAVVPAQAEAAFLELWHRAGRPLK